jgi:hypothetical protein
MATANTRVERLTRDENLRYIRKAWKRDSGYHGRSSLAPPARAGVAETAMFRMKAIFGDHLSARLLETQTSQALIRCAALNRMTHLGMPQSYKVTA